MLVRRAAHWITFWSAGVRFPLIAYSLGAAMQYSPWLIAPGLFLLIGFAVDPRILGIITGLGSIPVFFLIPNPWCACFLAALGFSAYVECRSEYLHDQAQTKLLTADLLSPTSGYSFDEIPVPQGIYEGFPSYAAKEAGRALRQKAAGWTGVSDAFLHFNAKPVRVFRFQSAHQDRSVGAAVAYPFHWISSLVFVREDFDSLSDAQRFQIYHELAHGTGEGTDVLLKPIRWRTSNLLASIFMTSFFIVSCAVVYRDPSFTTTASLICLGFGNYLRLLIVLQVQKLSLAASEVLADSVALTHPDFSAHEKWKTRAANQAQRLEDELADMPIDAPRRMQVGFRALWLRRWLFLGEVPPYPAADVDPRALIAFVFYLAAGAMSALSQPFGRVCFWITFVTCAAISNLLAMLNSGVGSVALVSVEEALEALLARKVGARNESAPSVALTANPLPTLETSTENEAN
jgi:hypothetical protein